MQLAWTLDRHLRQPRLIGIVPCRQLLRSNDSIWIKVLCTFIRFRYIWTKFGNFGHSLPFVHSLSTFSPRSWQSESFSFYPSPSNLIISLTKWVFRVKVSKYRRQFSFLRKIQNLICENQKSYFFLVKIQFLPEVEFPFIFLIQFFKVVVFPSNFWFQKFKVVVFPSNSWTNYHNSTFFEWFWILLRNLITSKIKWE